MGLSEVAVFTAVGAMAGWLASLMRPRFECDVLDNFCFGICGALLGGYVIGHLGLGHRDIDPITIGSAIISAITLLTIGAVIGARFGN